MLALIIISSILLYIFIGCVVGVVGYKYLMDKHPYWYDEEVGICMVFFGLFWPISWLVVGLVLAMYKGVIHASEFVSNQVIK